MIILYHYFFKIWQCPEGHVICGKCRARTEIELCPQCRIVKNNNFSRSRLLEVISRMIFPEVTGRDEVTARKDKEFAAKVEVPEVCLPTYDDMEWI